MSIEKIVAEPTLPDPWHWLRHRWSQWVPYIRAGRCYPEWAGKDGTPFSERWQQRRCLTCGKTEDVLL